jgi:putative ABC transport system permease protein
MALRSLLRRRGRLALTVGLLGLAGGLFVTGLNTAAGWSRLVDEGLSGRHYDLEVRLTQPVPEGPLRARLEGLPGVARVEAWPQVATSVARPGLLDLSRVYPDQGHGSFTLTGLPPGTALLDLPLREGRWLRPDDTDAVVVNQLVGPQQAPGLAVGDDLSLTVSGRPTRWHVVGVVSNFGTPASAYAVDRAVQALLDPAGVQLVRVVTQGHDEASRAAALGEVERALAAAKVPVRDAVPLSQLRSALDGHVMVLVDALLALAAVMALVGLLGLASSLSTSVLERTRELAVLQTLGATPAFVRGLVVREGLVVGGLSLGVAAAAAVPLTLGLGRFIGLQAFALPLPFSYSFAALFLWTVFVGVGAAVASAAPAQRAARLSLREALTH